MSRFWRYLTLACASIAVLAGLMLLMGNRLNNGATANELELTRLRTQASAWEARIEAVRSCFRDQLLRRDVLALLDPGNGLADWRIAKRLQQLGEEWPTESAIPRGLAIVAADGWLRTASGDTTGISRVIESGRGAALPNLQFVDAASASGAMMALSYTPLESKPESKFATFVALYNLSGVLQTNISIPVWTLMSGSGIVLAKSSRNAPVPSVSDATRPLLMTQTSGSVPTAEGGSLFFCTVRVPGGDPLLLAYELPIRRTARENLPVILTVAGLVLLLLLSVVPRTRAAREPSPAPITESDTAQLDGVSFRQIFQCLEDPICVVDERGYICRANRNALDLWRIRQGKPASDLTLAIAGVQHSVGEFVRLVSEDPVSVCGSAVISYRGEEHIGSIQASRIYRSEHGGGPVLLQFRREIAPTSVPASESSPSDSGTNCEVPDPYSPYPVLSVSHQGLITGFNEAARRACPRLEETPLITELLPDLNPSELLQCMSTGCNRTFESLFGSSTHEIELVRCSDGMLLYARPLTTSKSLQIALEQAQENFNTVCALVPQAVLLVDPRDHVIVDANGAAVRLFGRTIPEMRGRRLDALSTEPFDPAAPRDVFYAQRSDGRTLPCVMHCELIKVEGVPAVLIVLDDREQIPTDDFTSAPIEQVAPISAAPAPPPPLPLGPGLLIALSPTVRDVARRLLEKVGHPCEVFSSLDDATVWLITHDLRPEYAAVDVTDYDAAESWLDDLRARCGDVPCIALTDGGDYPLPNSGLNACLEKPFDLDSLAASLNNVGLTVEIRVPAEVS